jgi:Skp family chaperone for outer membrane proteins
MQNQTILGAALLALLFAAPVSAAPAPSVPTAPSAQDKLEFGGPLVANVCLLSREQVFTQSLVGQAAAARLKQLGQKAQANFDAERRKLESEARALQGQQAVLPPAQIQHRQQQLQARAQAAQAEAGQTERELEATRTKAMARIEDAVQPIVLDAYKAKGCGLLLSREAVIGGNMGADLTAGVIKALDAKMTTIDFDRERLPPGPAPR